MTEPAIVTVAIGRFPDLLGRGLRSLVEDDPSLELSAEDIAPAQLSSVLRQRTPRVVIIDTASLRSPVEVRKLTSRHPTTHLLLLSDGASGVEAGQLLAFGAAACLDKSTQERDVLNAIHLASRGLQLIPRRVGTASPGSGLLTVRESDVLVELQRRRSNAQIAADLSISIETVRTHARHIYRKLGVSSRRELLAPAGLS
jgi:DNA-binding NarL/FixJ family response regulator